MKKIITLLILLAFLVTSVFANNISSEKRLVTLKYGFIYKPTMFTIYKDLFPIDLEIKNNKLLYHNHIMYEQLIKLAKKLGRNDVASKLEASIALGSLNVYLWELYNLTWNLNNYNPKYFAKHSPYRFKFEKSEIILNRTGTLLSTSLINFVNGVNNIVVCYSTNLTKDDFESNKSILWKYAFCSIPKKIYYYHWKYFLDKNKYEQYKNKYDKNHQWQSEFKYKLVYNKFKYFHLEDLFNKIKQLTYEFAKNNYRIWLPTKTIQIQAYDFANKLADKFAIYNWQKIVPDKIDLNDIYYVVLYYYKQYVNQVNNQHQQKLIQTEQYKQQALSNYWELQKRYNQLKQEYEQYKLKTAENRQKAIKLTIILTKVLSKYHDKQTKLKLLDQIDKIIQTKYWPDKFKNQDLIWYVKDYLKIIRFAIQLSN